MNILFVTGQFPNSEKTYLGGMSKAVYKCAQGMEKHGHNVRILSAGSEARRWKYRGISVISVRASDGMQDSCMGMVYNIINREIQFQKEIRRLDREKPIDVIHYAGWFGVGLFHGIRIPAVMRISSYSKVQLDSVYQGAKGICLNALERIAISRMNVVYAPSRVMAIGVEKDTGRKVRVLETPYDAEDWEPDIRIWEKKLKGKKYFLFFGRLSKDKGIYVIRDCLYEVLKHYPEMSFVFAGTSGNDDFIEGELKKAAGVYRERVIFMGRLSPVELTPVVANAQMVVMPSLMDNFPNACAEAMALGKIVIGTDGSSLEQFIKHGYNGYLARIGDSDSLLEQMKYVMEMDEKDKMDISIHAKERIAELSPTVYFNKLEKMYIRLCKHRRKQI